MKLNLTFWKNYTWCYDSDKTKAVNDAVEHVEKYDEYPTQLVLTVEGYPTSKEGYIYQSMDEMSASKSPRKVALYKLVEIVEIQHPAVVTSLKKFDENGNNA